MDLPLITLPATPAALPTPASGEGFAALLAGMVAGNASAVPETAVLPDAPAAPRPLMLGTDAGPGDAEPEATVAPDSLPTIESPALPASAAPVVLLVLPPPPAPVAIPTASAGASAPMDAGAPTAPRALATPTQPPGAEGLPGEAALKTGQASILPPVPASTPTLGIGATTAPVAGTGLAEGGTVSAATPAAPYAATPSAPPAATPAGSPPAQVEPAAEPLAPGVVAPAIAAARPAAPKPGLPSAEAAPSPRPTAPETVPADAPKETMGAMTLRGEAAPRPEPTAIVALDLTAPAAPRDVGLINPVEHAQAEAISPIMRAEAAAPSAPPPSPPPSQPGDAAPAPRPAPVATPARQIAPFAVALALGPDARLDLILDPVELGRVDVAIERQGNEAVVSLRVERPETLALLQRDRAELERALSDAGFKGSDGGGASLSFSLGGDGTRQERRAPSGQRHAPAPAPDAMPRVVHPRGLIDLAL